jgi:hypothetical protein
LQVLQKLSGVGFEGYFCFSLKNTPVGGKKKADAVIIQHRLFYWIGWSNHAQGFLIFSPT